MTTIYQTIKTEIDADTLVRGYSGMTDDQVADDLNTVYRTRNKALMTSSEIINAVTVSEFNALSVADTAEFWNLMSLGNLNPFGVEATLLTNIFGGGSTTIADLNTLRRDNISRATELGLPVVREGDVQIARGIA